MSNLRRSSSSCLTIVAFIILAVLAARYYSGAESEKNARESSLYQKGVNAINEVWSYAKVLANVNLIKNLGVGTANLGQNIKKEFESTSVNNKNIDSQTETDVSSNQDINNGAVNSYDVENNRPLIDLTQDSGQVEEDSNNEDVQSNENSSNADSGDLKNVDLKKDLSSMFSYQKTSEGAVIIITSKSGAEYKLPLPFKFLAK